MDMPVILTQMGILVIIMLAGFVSAKLKITGPEFNKSATPVVMNLLLTSSIISSALNGGLSLSVGEAVWDIGFAFLMLAISGVVGVIVPKLLRIKGDDEGLSVIMIMLMNSVFVAFPVVEAVYGAKGLFYAALTNIPFNLLAYTYCTAKVRGGREKLSAKRVLTPPLIATFIALAIVLTGLRLPNVITQTLTAVGKATVPMSMLIIGTSLGAISIKEALSGWKVYIIIAVRLLLCPVLVWLVLRIFLTDQVLLGTYTIISAAPMAMLTSIFAIQYNKNEAYAAQSVFISTVLSAVTMPFIIWILL
ncbi:MAG: AEC family transporter [Oscillospiraceae bacterium]